MKVTVNGQEIELKDQMSLSELLAELELQSERVAVEVNKQVISRKLWSDTVIKEGDKIEIVHFVGGG